jgi:acyl-ACP thioesterase
MVYEYPLRIGISHIGRDGVLKLGAAVDVLQNATWFQLDTETAFMAYFRENNAGMYLVSRQIVVVRLPRYAENIRVRSWVTGCDRLFGYRNSAIYDETGALCIGAYAVGAFVDLEKAAPLRVPRELADQAEKYEALDMEILPRKIPIPGDMIQKSDSIRVQAYHLDNYSHMNNARYVDIASACLPQGFAARRIRMEYKKAALEGDIIVPFVSPACPSPGEAASLVITLNDPAGQPYTVMEFSRAAE